MFAALKVGVSWSPLRLWFGVGVLLWPCVGGMCSLDLGLSVSCCCSGVSCSEEGYYSSVDCECVSVGCG